MKKRKLSDRERRDAVRAGIVSARMLAESCHSGELGEECIRFDDLDLTFDGAIEEESDLDVARERLWELGAGESEETVPREKVVEWYREHELAARREGRRIAKKREAEMGVFRREMRRIEAAIAAMKKRVATTGHPAVHHAEFRAWLGRLEKKHSGA